MAKVHIPIQNINGEIIYPETSLADVRRSDDNPETLDSIITNLESSVGKVVDLDVDSLSTKQYTDNAAKTAQTEAVRLANSALANKIRVGTTDLEDGVSELSAGTLYVVYRDE